MGLEPNATKEAKKRKKNLEVWIDLKDPRTNPILTGSIQEISRLHLTTTNGEVDQSDLDIGSIQGPLDRSGHVETVLQTIIEGLGMKRIPIKLGLFELYNVSIVVRIKKK